MRVDLISLYPSYFTSPIESSLLGRASASGALSIYSHDLRTFGEGVRKNVDSRCLGGGPGMLLTSKPLVDALSSCRREGARVILMSPSGRKLTPALSRHYSRCSQLIIVCGHYEGVDERFIQSCVDDKVSVSDVVLTNGCLASLLFLDSVVRFVPGVLGCEASFEEESFEGDGLLEGPQYTLPRDSALGRVPKVFLSGDHSKIRAVRTEQSLHETKRWRPDLYAKWWKEYLGRRSQVDEAESTIAHQTCPLSKGYDHGVNFDGVLVKIRDYTLFCNYKKVFKKEMGLPTWEKGGTILAVSMGQVPLILLYGPELNPPDPSEEIEQFDLDTFEVKLSIASSLYDKIVVALSSSRVNVWKKLGTWTLSDACAVVSSEGFSIVFCKEEILTERLI